MSAVGYRKDRTQPKSSKLAQPVQSSLSLALLVYAKKIFDVAQQLKVLGLPVVSQTVSIRPGAQRCPQNDFVFCVCVLKKVPGPSRTFHHCWKKGSFVLLITWFNAEICHLTGGLRCPQKGTPSWERFYAPHLTVSLCDQTYCVV